MSAILALDTSGPSLSVALRVDEKSIFCCTQQNGLTHSDSLMTLVDEALTAGGLTPHDVDCYAAVNGPGSFTGVRIGVATVKSLSHAAGRPCIGINALEALARGAALFDGIVCPMQDARAGQVYCAAYRGHEQLLPDAAMKLEAFLEQLAPYGRCCFIGDGAVAHRTAIEAAMGECAVFASGPMMALSAAYVAELAEERFASAGDWRTLMPYYLRAPQAERERAAREASHG